jgi:hypothetical protein
MAKPNSRTTKIRNWLAVWIQPFPDMGEAWCLGCKLNQDKTLVIPLQGMQIHMARHAPKDRIRILTSKMAYARRS